MEMIFSLMFFMFIIAFVINIVRGIKQWSKNNRSPRLTVDALVVAKRADVTHHHHQDAATHAMHTTTSTDYYVTFEFESTDRLELEVKSFEYGMLREGDKGKLSFQGTRYLGFERES